MVANKPFRQFSKAFKKYINGNNEAWICSKCGFHNPFYIDECFGCGNADPEWVEE